MKKMTAIPSAQPLPTGAPSLVWEVQEQEKVTTIRTEQDSRGQHRKTQDNTGQHIIKIISVWPEDAVSQLQDCFEETYWDLFDQGDLKEYT